jgi:hypothetical protein
MTDAALREMFRVSDTWTDQQLDAIIRIHKALRADAVIQAYELAILSIEVTSIEDFREAIERAKQQKPTP